MCAHRHVLLICIHRLIRISIYIELLKTVPSVPRKFGQEQIMAQRAQYRVRVTLWIHFVTIFWRKFQTPWINIFRITYNQGLGIFYCNIFLVFCSNIYYYKNLSNSYGIIKVRKWIICYETLGLEEKSHCKYAEWQKYRLMKIKWSKKCWSVALLSVKLSSEDWP